MTELKLSAWHLSGIATIGISLMALSVSGAVYVGFQWGRASGLAAALAQHAGGEQPGTPMLPFEKDFPNQMGSGRPYLGVEFEMVTPDLTRAETIPVPAGAFIRNVISGSPADRAGLQVGDIILKVDRELVDESHPLPLIIAR